MFFSLFISNGWRFKQATYPILRILVELFPFNKITLKSRIFVLLLLSLGKQCWSQEVLESGSWGHSVLQMPALVLGCFVVYSMRRFVLSCLVLFCFCVFQSF